MSSKPLIKHYGRVVNGRKDYYNKALYYQQIALLEGKEFEEVIKIRHKKVTNDQYAYYFGAVLTTCFETELFCAFDKAADVHAYFEDKFLSYKTMIIVGDVKKEITKYHSLSQLGKKEMSEFIERVLMHLRNDLNIIVLSPEEFYLENYRTTKI